jgi:thiosulfate reductase cytochrome b subunit
LALLLRLVAGSERLLYLIVGLLNRSFGRKMWPTREELRHIGHSIWEHARLKWPEGEEAKKYNVVQKLTYLIVLLGLFPLVVLTGLTMSPGVQCVRALPAGPVRRAAVGADASTSSWRPLLVGFVLLHVGLVLVTGLWNNMRSMINGRYVIKHPAEGPSDAH